MELIDLVKYRKENSDNALDWSVEDALKAALEKAQAVQGRASQIVIAMVVDGEDGGCVRERWVAGCNRREALGLLSQMQYDLMASGEDD